MGKDSNIQWCDHTFNPWWGCVKIAQGCKNCYAETLAHRWDFDIWGADKTRRMMSNTYWNQPLKWDAEAERSGKTTRVFCGSMCDWLEDHPVANELRPKLTRLIRATPNLTWLMLTKRIHNLSAFVPEKWLLDRWPSHVWVGISASTQKELDDGWEVLEDFKHDFRVMTFLSLEPLVEEISLEKHLVHIDVGDAVEYQRWIQWPDWVIVGGESGPNARRCDEQWVWSLLNQCKEAKIPFFNKQAGSFAAKLLDIYKEDPKGEGLRALHPDMRVREFPEKMIWI